MSEKRKSSDRRYDDRRCDERRTESVDVVENRFIYFKLIDNKTNRDF